jgi:hypothetical protein
MSHKTLIELNQDHFEAIFFVEGKRVLSYGHVTRMQIILEHEAKQKAYKAPVALYIIPEAVADEMEKNLGTSAITFENDEKQFTARVAAYKVSHPF